MRPIADAWTDCYRSACGEEIVVSAAAPDHGLRGKDIFNKAMGIAARKIYQLLAGGHEEIENSTRNAVEDPRRRTMIAILLHSLAGLAAALAGRFNALLGSSSRVTKDLVPKAKSRLDGARAGLEALDIHGKYKYRNMAARAFHASLDAKIEPSLTARAAAQATHRNAAHQLENDHHLVDAHVDTVALKAHHTAAISEHSAARTAAMQDAALRYRMATRMF